MILLTSLLGGAANLVQLALFISIFSWANPSRSIRTMVLSLRERDFINTARFSRESLWTIIFREILPYMMSWSLSNFMNTILFAIGSESGLALLGLSSGNLVTLGNMIQWDHAAGHRHGGAVRHAVLHHQRLQRVQGHQEGEVIC